MLADHPSWQSQRQIFLWQFLLDGKHRSEVWQTETTQSQWWDVALGSIHLKVFVLRKKTAVPPQASLPFVRQPSRGFNRFLSNRFFPLS